LVRKYGLGSAEEPIVAAKYELEIGTNGIGYLDYFWDSWLWGKTLFNIINLDYDGAIVAYGCDSYFWIFNY